MEDNHAPNFCSRCGTTLETPSDLERHTCTPPLEARADGGANFCPRCGKSLTTQEEETTHSCTPPKDHAAETANLFAAGCFGGCFTLGCLPFILAGLAGLFFGGDAATSVLVWFNDLYGWFFGLFSDI